MQVCSARPSWAGNVSSRTSDSSTSSKTGCFVPAYREVIVTIPRQNGKTTLVLSWESTGASCGADRNVSRTPHRPASTPARKLLEDQLPMIERSILGAAIENVRRAQGSEGIDFRGGSQLDVLASTESAGHGRTLDLGVIDEAFKDVDDRREGAMLPAMVTRPTRSYSSCRRWGLTRPTT
jgi:phage terminase large subunit-like protein